MTAPLPVVPVVAAPLQWYCALGTTPTRYVIYKDTAVDPLLTPLAAGRL